MNILLQRPERPCFSKL